MRNSCTIGWLGLLTHASHSQSHISSLSKSCFLSISDLRRIRNSLPFHCLNHLHRSHSFQGRLLQLSFSIFLAVNSAARAVSKTTRFSHILPIFKSLYWLKIDQRIQYKVFSHLQNTASQKPWSLQPFQPASLHLYSFIFYYYSSFSHRQLSSQNNR